MPSPSKKPESNEKDINQQLHDTIYKKVTRKTHNYGSPQKGDGTIKTCIKLFKKGASPKTLAELEESLIKQKEDYEYYIQDFLPALKTKITNSTKLDKEKAKEIGGIIEGITKRNRDKNHSDSTMQNQNTTADAVEVPSGANTSKLSSGSDLDSGIESPRKSEESSRSPVSSRRSSISSILSSAGENNNLQKENENQMQPKQAAPEEPKMQESENSGDQRDQVKNGVSPGVIQVADTEIQREKNMDPSGQTTQMTGSQAKDSMQPEEKKDRENATPIVQKLPVNEKKGEDTPLKKQPNNRNLHVALVAGCALSTIGCIVAGAMTSGLIGAGLLAMAAAFAIAAVAELHSNFLSSKLTSISVEPHVNDKELTACSRL